MKIFSISITLLLISTMQLLGQATADEQIKLAVLAAPTEQRDGAMVYGFDENGEIIKLREGTNQFVCLANNPSSNRYQSSCYHKSLEPFMQRGRELRAEGKTSQEVFDIREKESKDGTLKMPENPAALHVYYGSDVSYNEEEDKLDGAQYRYVVYIPFATQESTGLSLRPNGAGHPWLMNPGTHGAHIMITPPRERNN